MNQTSLKIKNMDKAVKFSRGVLLNAKLNSTRKYDRIAVNLYRYILSRQSISTFY